MAILKGKLPGSIRKARKAARMAAKATVGAGKVVSVVKPGVGRKMVATTNDATVCVLTPFDVVRRVPERKRRKDLDPYSWRIALAFAPFGSGERHGPRTGPNSSCAGNPPCTRRRRTRTFQAVTSRRDPQRRARCGTKEWSTPTV